MEERIHDLESQVTALRINNAQLSTSLEHLSKAVSQLQSGVDALNETISKGKGAMAVIGGAGLAAGTLIHWFMDFFAGHK